MSRKEGKVRKKHRITFACTENTCRSPMAKVIFEDILSRDGVQDIEVDSVALVRAGSAANEKAREIIRERYGYDLLKDHIPKLIDKEVLGRLVVVMTADQKNELNKVLGEYHDETIVLKVSELLLPGIGDCGFEFGEDIADPESKSLDDYRMCLELLAWYLSRGSDKALEIARYGLYAKWTETDGPKACPSCASRRIVPIMYGLPTEETIAEYRWYGLIGRDPPCELGGCCLPDTENWHCWNCGHEWAHGQRFNHQRKELGSGSESRDRE